MKKLQLKLDGKAILSKDQMRSVNGGYGGGLYCTNELYGPDPNICYAGDYPGLDCDDLYNNPASSICYQECGYGYIPVVCGR